MLQNISTPTGWIFMKFAICVFFENVSKYFNSNLTDFLWNLLFRIFLKCFKIFQLQPNGLLWNLRFEYFLIMFQNISTLTGRTFMKFCYLGTFWKCFNIFQLQLDGFLWNLLFEYFLKIFQNISTPTGRIFKKFAIRGFFENVSTCSSFIKICH